MKIRIDFVTNRSSTAFIIVNKTKKTKTLVDFVNENPQLIDQYRSQYGHVLDGDCICQCGLVASANSRVLAAKNLTKKDKDEYSELHSGGLLKPGDNYVRFGDEQGDLIGRVFDYILRDGGKSKSFSWRFKEWLR